MSSAHNTQPQQAITQAPTPASTPLPKPKHSCCLADQWKPGYAPFYTFCQYLGKITGYVTRAGHGCGWALTRARVANFQPSQKPSPAGKGWRAAAGNFFSLSLAEVLHIQHLQLHILHRATAAELPELL